MAKREDNERCLRVGRALRDAIRDTGDGRLGDYAPAAGYDRRYVRAPELAGCAPESVQAYGQYALEKGLENPGSGPTFFEPHPGVTWGLRAWRADPGGAPLRVDVPWDWDFGAQAPPLPEQVRRLQEKVTRAADLCRHLLAAARAYQSGQRDAAVPIRQAVRILKLQGAMHLALVGPPTQDRALASAYLADPSLSDPAALAAAAGLDAVPFEVWGLPQARRVDGTLPVPGRERAL